MAAMMEPTSEAVSSPLWRWVSGSALDVDSFDPDVPDGNGEDVILLGSGCELPDDV